MSPSLRKAAILVSSLDTRSADALLDQMGEAEAGRVRNAIMELGDVNPAEQQQIIAQFLGGQSSDSSGGVELELSEQSKAEPAFPVGSAQDEKPSAPFAFLRQADGDIIAACLERERPQVAAIVLAHLAPDQAAQVLSHLPSSLRGEVLHRLAHLNTREPVALKELEEHLQHRLAPYLQTDVAAGKGVDVVQAILLASTAGMQQEILAQLSVSDSTLAREVGKAVAVPVTPSVSPNKQPVPAGDDRPRKSQPAISMRDRGSRSFDQLQGLDERGWRVLLRIADPQVARLALTGADPRLVDTALAWLPAAEARRTRQKLEHPGPVSLRELDEARVELLDLAHELEAEGRLRLQLPRHTASAF